MSRTHRRHEAIVEHLANHIKWLKLQCENDSDAVIHGEWRNGDRRRGERVVSEAHVADVVRTLIRDFGEEPRLTITIFMGRFVPLAKVMALLRDPSDGQPFVMRYGVGAHERYRGCMHRADGDGFFSVRATLRFLPEEAPEPPASDRDTVRVSVSQRSIAMHV
jgi:hypothetical protein